MSDKKSNRIKLGSPESPVRFSYAFFFEPRESKGDDGEAKSSYQCSVLIPKSDKAAKAAIDAAVQEVINEKFKGKSTNLKLPLRDGDEEWEEKGEAYKGHWFFNCSSKQKPEVVGTERDIEGKLIKLGADDVKSGDYGRISVNFFDFTGKSKGVGVGMGNVQKLKDGEPLGNKRSADDDFGDLEDGFQD